MTDAAYAEPNEPDLTPEQPEAHGEQASVKKLIANITAVNLADKMDPTELARIGQKVVEEYEIDLNSRIAAGWDQRHKAAMDLALQVKTAKNHPWPNASNIKYPLISTAAIQFNARAYPALIDGFNIVKGKVLGSDQGDQAKGVPPGAKQARAERIGDHMSYQLMEEMAGWEEGMDRLMMVLPIVGCAFKKSYFDPVRGTNCSDLVMADKFVVAYMTKDLDSCPRATHELEFYPHEILEKVRGGLWCEHDLGIPEGANNDNDAPHTFLEQHRLLDLDGDDYPEPYIVTVHKETMHVMRIVARYDKGGIEELNGTITRIKPVRIFTKYPFIPAPDGSFYDIGFGMLLDAFNETINTILNQITDAATLANTQGGFIGEGVSIKSGSARFMMGEFKRVDTGGGMLKDSIVPFSFPGPSQVLYNLMEFLIGAAKDVTATQDILTGDTTRANQPVGTTLAAIEQGLKSFTAIVKRLHRALKDELACLYRLNSIYLKDEDYFRFQDKEGVIARQDYAQGDCDVVPVSDPSMATDMQKMARAQFLKEQLQGPEAALLNVHEILERVFEAAGIQDIDKLFAPAPDPNAPPPPDVQLKQKAAQQKDRELDQKDIELGHAKQKLVMDEAELLAKIGLQEAQAELATAQARAAGLDPQTAALIVQQTVEHLLAQTGGQDGGQPDPVQSGDVRGMAGAPADGPVPPVPQGPAGPPQGAMGPGPGNGPPPPDQGPSPGGPVGPPVA